MTAACGGGTSSLKSGTPTTIIVGAGLITEGLGIISPWLLPFAIYLDAITYQTATSCGTDPPAMPTSDQLNPINAIGGVLNPNFETWLGYAQDLILNWLWLLYCQCDSGPQPPAIAPLNPPAGTGLPSPSSQGSCYQGVFSGTPTEYTTPTTDRFNNDNLTPAPATSTHTFGSGQIAHTCTVPVGTYKSVNLAGSVSFPAGSTKNLVFELNEFTSGGTFIDSPFFSVSVSAGATVTFNQTIQVAATAGFENLECAQTNETHPATVNVTATWNCSSSPTGSASAPCVTDPAVLQLLQTMQQELVSIYQAIPAAVTSFSDGASHAGLTGSGSFALSAGVIAIRVHITSSIPPNVGIDAGDPTHYEDAGFITYEAGGDPYGPQRLVFDNQLFIAPLLADAVHYTLAPGLTVTIVEIHRGP
jgi:hypothetical protein